MKVYIAGPLFNDGDKAYNLKIDAIIRECGHETWLPQRDIGCVSDMPDTVDGIPMNVYVCQHEFRELEKADIFLLLMDGRVPDEGACVELGYCYALNKRCIGYQTDVRKGFLGENNIMVDGALDMILHNEDELRRFFGEISQ